MKKILLLACALSFIALPNLRAEEDDPAAELSYEMQSMQADAQKLLAQVQQTTESAAQHGLNPGGFVKAREKMMRLASDEPFLKAAGILWNSPQRNTLLIVQGIFFVAMLVLKAWRQARASNWFTRMLVGFLLSLVTWFGLLFVIPSVVLGEPYRVVIGHIWRVIVS